MKRDINNRIIFMVLIVSIMMGCKNSEEKSDELPNDEPMETSPALSATKFGQTSDSMEVKEYTLKNDQGVEVKIINYGGTITSLKVPDKDGNLENVVLGFDNVQDYEKGDAYFGAIIGRYGNRIANGKFSIDGTDYTLATNNNENHLHGGLKGFDKVVWSVDTVNSNSKTLKLNYLSKDMEEGYPGNLNCTVTYTLSDDNVLEMDYQATTDKKTIVNLTNHSYFNLSGDFSKTILDHEVMINADSFIPVTESLIPTGEIKSVENTPFDFREAIKIGSKLDQESSNEQLKRGLGYDHCWVLNDAEGMSLAATAYDPGTGRFMEVKTNEPGIQFYIGNFLNGSMNRPDGGTYDKRTGFCLETQHYPDTPNQKEFPSVILEPGETYTSKTTFKFSTK